MRCPSEGLRSHGLDYSRFTAVFRRMGHANFLSISNLPKRVSGISIGKVAET